MYCIICAHSLIYNIDRPQNLKEMFSTPGDTFVLVGHVCPTSGLGTIPGQR